MQDRLCMARCLTSGTPISFRQAPQGAAAPAQSAACFQPQGLTGAACNFKAQNCSVCRDGVLCVSEAHLWDAQPFDGAPRCCCTRSKRSMRREAIWQRARETFCCQACKRGLWCRRGNDNSGTDAYVRDSQLSQGASQVLQHEVKVLHAQVVLPH
jgi:hypothetical protein